VKKEKKELEGRVAVVTGASVDINGGDLMI